MALTLTLSLLIYGNIRAQIDDSSIIINYQKTISAIDEIQSIGIASSDSIITDQSIIKLWIYKTEIEQIIEQGISTMGNQEIVDAYIEIISGYDSFRRIIGDAIGNGIKNIEQEQIISEAAIGIEIPLRRLANTINMIHQISIIDTIKMDIIEMPIITPNAIDAIINGIITAGTDISNCPMGEETIREIIYDKRFDIERGIMIGMRGR